MLVPILILLGGLAGVGVIVRCFKASGIERKQLQWRAARAAVALVLFPLTVANALPDAASVVKPLVFVTTLVIPVLRFQLWSGAPVPRLRKVGLVVSRRTLVEVHEEERRRLRRDPHDGLGPLVTGLRLNLDAAQSQLATNPEKALEYLTNARQASAEVISDLRSLVYGLRPPALDELGLAETPGAQLSRFAEGSAVELVLHGDDTLILTAAVEVALYRTATEAVTNVVRHSRAQRCRVSLTTTGADVVLGVDDRRAGFRHVVCRRGPHVNAGAGGRARRDVPSQLRTGRVPHPDDVSEEAGMTTGVLVDDHPLVRQGMRSVIDPLPHIEVVGEASDGAQAVQVCVELKPDVVLMDLQLPTVNGIEATRQVRARSPGTSVLVLTMYDDDAMVFEAVASGASGYLLKGSDGADIVAAIQAAAAGQAVFGAALAQRMQSWFGRRPPAAKPFPQLIEREHEILDGVAAGMTNPQIGAKLFLSPKTVANNISMILDRLQVAHRAEAIVKAREAGLGGASTPT